ncbi:glutamate racemase [Piscinibacter sp. HJYY11]|uniref:glutamate racemase n=1 Tax=Piscinibacter sp. HJYY11 TaxID=2801333 RepID=UPI00191CB774|nr:glutamate racemase [Piscinibacter sp. HJYY11]MBL0726801.1 glutamate racemase [Piscinibacter sp. HJYY11]
MNPTRTPLVGVFDSGVGGLSVLKALHSQLPAHDLLYVADSAHAPYGERTDEYISQRTHRIASHLLAEGASLLVIACNTATAVAVASLRERWPQVPIVAVEPGVKPAVALTRNGRIGVMATPATLRSEKFKHLLSAHGAGLCVHLQPCPGLAGQIERGIHDDPALLRLIDQFSAPLKEAEVDTVVLGCTHYPFVHAQIQQAFGNGVTLVDTAEPVARQAARLLNVVQPTSAVPRRVCLQTTGEAARLQELAGRWLPFECQVAHAPGL